jgi:putative MATE family efflux protein
MKNLTQGSIPRHILAMAAPIAIGMIIQVLYQLIDLYFVSTLGDAAIAGVSAAGNTTFIVVAVTQVLGVGTVALISHAVGRQDQADANLVFNQALTLSGLCGVAVLIAGYLVSGAYMRSVAADAATVQQGTLYLHWLLPGLALQFALISLSSALRGTGIVKPTMLVQSATVLINAGLAPILIKGWGTGIAFGVAGAGLATSLAVACGVVMLWIYFQRLEHYVAANRSLQRPQWRQWWRLFEIGLPSGGELGLLFVSTAISYYAIRHFGAAAQAGYGIGSRVMQAIMLPAMAIAFATGPIAGQNFGARKPERVRQAFRQAAVISSAAMLLETLIAQWRPEFLIGMFTSEPGTLAVGVSFLRFISINFVAQGLVFTCSAMFQGLGNTKPSLLSSCIRILTFAIPVILLSSTPAFRIEDVWYFSIGTSFLQAIISLLLLHREFRRRLTPMSANRAAEADSSPV